MQLSIFRVNAEWHRHKGRVYGVQILLLLKSGNPQNMDRSLMATACAAKIAGLRGFAHTEGM